MAAAQTEQTAVSRCTLCPAACQLQLAGAGPDAWRAEYPSQGSAGLCPRGSAVCELLSSHLRISTAMRRRGPRLAEVSIASVLREIVSRASGGLTVLLDGNMPCEQLASAAAWCNAWPQARLCIAVEPADKQMLTGIDSSGAEYLPASRLADCDGFVVIGDAFAANPMCSRGVLDRRAGEPRTPIVVIDPAAGTASKFATHNVAVGAGMELAALAAVAASAGVDGGPLARQTAGEMSSAEAAGKAIAGCKRLAVLIAAEYGRAAPWQQIGYLAGLLAKGKGGGAAAQTVGANALAAVRTAAATGAISLAEALSDGTKPRLAVGCDVAGMLGREDIEIFAAAAPLPNETTDAAEIILPLAMNEELSGTIMADGDRPVRVSPLMSPPVGVVSPASLIAALVKQAGVSQARPVKEGAPLPRLQAGPPAPATVWKDPSGPLVLLGRQAANSGCGAVTGCASWQQALNQTPELRVSSDVAEAHKLKNLGLANLKVAGSSLSFRIRIAPELGSGIMVMPEGLPQVRKLLPSRIDAATGTITCEPVCVPQGLFGG